VIRIIAEAPAEGESLNLVERARRQLDRVRG
jgi:hypothetical protein